MHTFSILVLAALMPVTVYATVNPIVERIEFKQDSRSRAINIDSASAQFNSAVAYIGEKSQIIVTARNNSNVACRDAAIYVSFEDLDEAVHATMISYDNKGGLSTHTTFQPGLDDVWSVNEGRWIRARHILCRVGTNTDNPSDTWPRETSRTITLGFTPDAGLWRGNERSVMALIKCTMTDGGGAYGKDPSVHGAVRNSNLDMRSTDQQGEWCYNLAIQLRVHDDVFSQGVGNRNAPNPNHPLTASESITRVPASSPDMLVLAHNDWYEIRSVPADGELVVRSRWNSFEINPNWHGSVSASWDGDYYTARWRNQGNYAVNVPVRFNYSGSGVHRYWFEYFFTYFDDQPPVFGSPHWEVGSPAPEIVGPNNYSIRLRANEATDNRSSVLYCFEQQAPAGNWMDVSGWISTRTWNRQLLTPNTQYSFRYRIKDNVDNLNQSPSQVRTVYTHLQAPVIEVGTLTSDTISLSAHPVDSSYSQFINLGNGESRIRFIRGNYEQERSLTSDNGTVVFSGLEPNTEYYFIAESRNVSNVKNPNTDDIFVTTLCATPDAPREVLLTSERVRLSPGLNDQSNATYWRIYVYQKGRTELMWSTDLHSKDAWHEFPVNHGVTYEARVYAYNKDDRLSNASPIYEFTPPDPVGFLLRSVIFGENTELYAFVDRSAPYGRLFTPGSFNVSSGESVPVLTWQDPYDDAGYRYERTGVTRRVDDNATYPANLAASSSHAGVYIQQYARKAVRFARTTHPTALNSGVNGEDYVEYGKSVSRTAKAEDAGYSFHRWRRTLPTHAERGSPTLTFSAYDNSVPETWVAEYTDQTPPEEPTLGISPEAWTNDNTFAVSWTKPTKEISQIDRVYYTIGEPPSSVSDGEYRIVDPVASNGVFSVTIPDDGEIPIYVWLRDAAGNVDYRNHSQVTARLDRVAPVDGSFSINGGETVTESHIVNLTNVRASDGDLSGVSHVSIRNNNGRWSQPIPYPGDNGQILGWSLIDGGASLALKNNVVRMLFRDAAGNWMSEADAASVMIDYDPPDLEPPILAATGKSETVVDLRLSPVGVVTRQIIQWSTNRDQLDAGNFMGEFARNAGDEWTREHTGLLPGTWYYYRAMTTNATFFQKSGWTYASARTWDKPPTAATGFTVSPHDYQRIDTSWNWVEMPGSGPATGHRLQWRHAGSSGWNTVSKPEATSQTHSVTGLSPDTSYEFRVGVVNDYHEVWTAPVTRKTYRLPELTVTPASHDFEAVQGPNRRPSLTSHVANTGDGVLTWTSAVTGGQAIISPSSGTLNGGASTPVTVTLITDDLPEGAAQFGIVFRSTIDGTLVERPVVYSGTILNTAPVVSNVWITPAAPVSRMQLTGSYDYFDADDHPEGQTQIVWHRNGAQFGSGFGTVPAHEVVKGQRWRFSVTPHDGYKFGETVQSPEITIANAPPVIAGRSIEMPQGGSYTLNLRTISSDPDDPVEDLSFSIVNSPPAWLGAAISGHVLNVNPAADQSGPATVRVRVSDGEKHAEANMSVYVDAPPWLTGLQPDAYDVDEDTEKRINLWPFFADDRTLPRDMRFEATSSCPEMFVRIDTDNRHLVISGATDWPSNDDGPQTNPITVTAYDRPFNQSVSWSPVITFHPVNDPPRWTGYIEDVLMTDADPDPLAVMSTGGHSLRTIVTDVDTDLDAVSDDQLFSVSSSDPGLTVTLEGDQIRIIPDGGWWKSATVTVTANDRETRYEPFNATASTTFRVTVVDDDTEPPAFSGFQAIMIDPEAQAPSVRDGEIRVQEQAAFHIACTIVDSQSGVYDDDTGGGPGEQGVYLVWADDGTLGNGYNGLIQLSRVEGDTFRTDEPIPAQDGAVADGFVYEIFAWDDNFDRGYAGDRKMGRTGPRRDIVINDLPEVFPLPPDGEQHIEAPLRFSLTDANRDPLDVTVEYLDPRDDAWYTARIVDALGSLTDYAERTVVWQAAYQDKDGDWVGDLPGLDIGDPEGPYPDPVRVRFRAFDGHHYGPYSEIAFHLDNNLLPELALSPTAAIYDAQGWDHLPRFNISLSDVEQDVLSLRIEHRWDPDGDWLPTTFSFNGGAWQGSTISNITAEIYHLKPLTVRWDAVADAVRDGVVPDQPGLIEGVQIRFTPNDGDSTEEGATVVSGPFAIDLFPPARVLMPEPPDVENEHAGFRRLDQTYRIAPGYVRHESGGAVWYSDVAGRNLGAGVTNAIGPVVTMRYAFQYAGDPGIHLIDPVSGYLTGLNLTQKSYVQYRNLDLDVSWNFSADDSGLPQERISGVMFLVAADHHKPGDWTATEPADLNNNFSPVVQALTVAADGNRVLPDGALRGDVAFALTLWDREADPMTLRYEYSLDGATWHPATPDSPARYRGLAPGEHRLVWRVVLDLPLTAHETVWFRVAADDEASEGAWRTLDAPIALDNRNMTPSVTNLRVSPVDGHGSDGPIEIRFTVADENDDACRVSHAAISTNGGLDWIEIPPEALFGRVPGRPGEHVLLWDPRSGPLGEGLWEDIWFRLAVDDGAPFVSEANSTGQSGNHALTWDGTDLWTFDLAATPQRGWRHDLTAAGWPAKDAAGHSMGTQIRYPETLDAAGKSNSPWLLWPGTDVNESWLMNLGWNGTQLVRQQPIQVSGLVGVGFAWADDDIAYATVPASRTFAEIDTVARTASFSGRLESLLETKLAHRTSQMDGDMKAGLWTLEAGTGLLRQYEPDPDTGAWTCVRLLDSGIVGLRALDFQADILWTLDQAEGRLIRSEEISVSRLIHTGPFSLDLRGEAGVAPVVTDVTLLPAEPGTMDDLSLVVSADNPSASKMIRWVRNGAHVSALDDAETVSAMETSAGDTWQAMVWLRDGDRLSEAATSLPVTIDDTAPRAGSLAATPAAPFTEEPLSVTGWPVDPDGGPVSVTYVWERDGVATDFVGATVPYWATQAGELWQATVTAEDRTGLTSTFDFEWTIGNRPPVFETIGPQTVQEADWLWFRLEANDPEEHAITYGMIAPEPALPGLVMWHPEGRTFFWYPSYTASGEYELQFTATDALGAVATQTVSVTVLDTPRPPWLHAANDIVVYEGDTIDLLAGNTGGHFDLAPGNLPLSVLKELGITFEVTGWKEDEWSEDYTYQTTFEDSGQHAVEIVAVDANGLVSSPRTVHIYVHDVNRPPVLNLPGDVSVMQHYPVTFSISATDPDDDALHLYWDGPFGSSVTENGPGEWTFDWTPGLRDAGVYTAWFEVRDDGEPILSATGSVSITVAIDAEADTDGDGLLDAWELYYFGNLDRDGTGDAAGNGFTDKEEHDAGTDPLCFYDIPPTATRSYALSNGWNTIALDLTYDDMTVAGIMTPILDQIRQVRWWDAEAQRWNRWDRLNPEFDNPADSATMPICVYSVLKIEIIEACTLTLTGSTSQHTLWLYPGWNHVAPPSFITLPTDVALAPVAYQCERLSDGSQWYFPETGSGIENLSQLAPRESYWLKMHSNIPWRLRQ